MKAYVKVPLLVLAISFGIFLLMLIGCFAYSFAAWLLHGRPT